MFLSNKKIIFGETNMWHNIDLVTTRKFVAYWVCPKVSLF